MRRIAIIAVGAAIAVSVLPSTASAGKNKGTWTFTDTTPDPTVVTNDASHHCTGTVPAAPIDVNEQTFKAKKRRGTLKLTAHNAADWAMEVRDKNGTTIAGTDGEDPMQAESISVSLRRGTYTVVYCSFAGEPQITVNYSYR